MTKHLTALLAIILTTCLPMAAISIETLAAGSLQSLIEKPGEVTELVIAGPINAYDLDFIDTNMPTLSRLDLTEASIVAASGKRLHGISSHAAGHIPARIFTGSAIRELRLPAHGSISIGDAAFAGAAIEAIVLADNVKSIGTGAFSSCPALTSATLSIAEVAEAAFAGCSALRTVTLTAPVAVADFAFSGCSCLATVDGADRITSIGRRAFADCSALTDFTFGSGLSNIADEAFLAAGLHEADLAPCSALKSIGDRAFAHMPELISVDLGRAGSIGDGIVFDCPALVHLEFSSATDSLPALAYAKDTALDTIGIMHDDIVYIGDHALHGLAQVKTITLPSALEYIGDGAMEGMTGLERINISAATPPATGLDVWAGLNRQNIVLQVSDAAEAAYRAADQWQDFSIFGVSGIRDALDQSAGQALRARFVGDILVVESSGIDLRRISIYNVDGQLIDSLDGPVDHAEFDTSGTSDKIFLIGAALADRRAAALKIAKN